MPMENEELLNQYTEVRECEYKDRCYLARDNGAICRLPKEGGRPSKLDNVWSFGIKNPETGYMIFTGNIRVHQVVCTAFHGPEPEPHMVVDHKDTNRCNNRPENLQWLTRLENALNNPATRKKIIYLCGSIEAFIENPAILRSKALPPNVEWMRTVTKEEAAKCKKHIDRWTEEDRPKGEPTGQGVGEWIYEEDKPVVPPKPKRRFQYAGPYKSYAEHMAAVEEMNRIEHEKQYGLKDSLTLGAKQLEWKTLCEFPQTPQAITETPLQDYLARLTKGAIYCKNQYSESPVYDAAMAEDRSHLAVVTEISGVTNYALSEVYFQDGFFVHKSIRTFFTEEGAQKYFTLSLGREWTGGDVMEDYC